MHRGHSRLFVIVDDGGEVFQAARRALERLRPRRPPIHIPQPAVARQYLKDAFRHGSTPAAIIIRVHEQDDAPLMLLDWIQKQPAPLCFTQVLVVLDAEIDECHGAVAVWMENAFRHILHLSERGFAEELSVAVETHRREDARKGIRSNCISRSR
jgi:hypothetical protein